MALVIEDGTGKADANSYADLATIRSQASALGVTLSAVDATLEVSVLKAMRYLDTRYATLFKGVRTTPEVQALEWPRENACIIAGVTQPSDELPPRLIECLTYLTIQVEADQQLFSNAAGSRRGTIIRERVDVLEREYSDMPQLQRSFGGLNDAPTELAALIAPLINGGLVFRMVRT